MKKGDKVIISGEAVADQNISTNKGVINKLFTEPCIGEGDDYEFVEVLLPNGDKEVVGQHEIKLI